MSAEQIRSFLSYGLWTYVGGGGAGIVKPSESIQFCFETSQFSTGASYNATSILGVLVRNAIDTVVVVTVTNKSTGSYAASFTIPSDAVAGELFEVRVEATVDSVAAKMTMWRGTVDTKFISDVGADVTCVKAAVYDSQSFNQAGSSITLSNGAVLTYSANG